MVAHELKRPGTAVTGSCLTQTFHQD